MATPDLEFFFDPSCPFCWMTSKWVRVVRDEIGIDVRWSYISLVTLNEPYDEGDEYEEWHHGGRRMHRVIAAAAEKRGDEVIGPLYEAIGSAIWETPGTMGGSMARAMGEKADLPVILETMGLDPGLAAAVDDDSHDHLFVQGPKEALARAGDGVGTPIITFAPDGESASSFFGPVISEVPSPADSVALYRALATAARIPTFSELKRSLREMPDLPLLRED